jgi:hypothetical protein
VQDRLLLLLLRATRVGLEDRVLLLCSDSRERDLVRLIDARLSARIAARLRYSEALDYLKVAKPHA